MGKSDKEFQEQVKQRRQRNLLELKELLAAQRPDKDFEEKIINYAERYDLPVSYVWDKLYSSNIDIELHGFEKDPSKQNIFECLQLDKVKELPVIMGVEKLAASGKNAKYVIDGKVVSLSEKEKKERNVKSIDFHWFYEIAGNRIDFYASCKYTHEGGGAQDNQKADVNFSFLREAQKTTENNLFFVALLDGEYYKEVPKNGISKMEELNSLYKGPRCKATDSDALPSLIKQVLLEWITSIDTLTLKEREAIKYQIQIEFDDYINAQKLKI